MENIDMNITDVAALIGIIFSTAALSISLLTYLRDRPKIIVRLQWDMAMTGEDPKKSFGIINVVNAGRRPIYISHASLKLPKGYSSGYLLIIEGISGKRLAEGDPPAIFTIDQSSVQEYKMNWEKVRAQVTDSAGNIYISKKIKKKPSWGR